MKTTKSILILSVTSLFTFGFIQSDKIPLGWFKSGDKPGSYKIGIDQVVFQHGKKSAFIESIEGNIAGFGTLMQSCNPKDFLGMKIKMTGYIKAENVSDWAGMWLRVDSKNDHKTLSFDNMQDRPIRGTSNWIKCEIVVDVPEESGSLHFGALISGPGKIWFDNISFEIVDKPASQISKESNTKPNELNLDFEE